MRLSSGEKTGITTVGATSVLIFAGIIFANLNPWWLLLGIPLFFSAVGHELGLVKK